MSERVAVVGLGYVGLPVALAFARKFPAAIGFDINEAKVSSLKSGVDVTGEVPSEVLKATTLNITSAADELKKATFFVVAVPTSL